MKYRSNRLTTEQIAEAEAIGVRFEPPYRDPKPKPPTRDERRERNYLTRLSWLEDFYREHGHINVPQLQGTVDWPGAGQWIASLRGRYRRETLPQSVVEAAETMNIAWNPGPGIRSP